MSRLDWSNSAVWNEWLEHGTPIEIGGRIGRMIQSDFSLTDVAPIASEWE